MSAILTKTYSINMDLFIQFNLSYILWIQKCKSMHKLQRKNFFDNEEFDTKSTWFCTWGHKTTLFKRHPDVTDFLKKLNASLTWCHRCHCYSKNKIGIFINLCGPIMCYGKPYESLIWNCLARSPNL